MSCCDGPVNRLNVVNEEAESIRLCHHLWTLRRDYENIGKLCLSTATQELSNAASLVEVLC